MSQIKLSNYYIKNKVKLALNEDLYPNGDITSSLVKNTKIIKTSIFGPELKTKASLMEWFLSQEGEINGYSEYYWNGNTTLTWAQYCLYLMFNWDELPIENILEGECVSKYNLLLLLKEVYNKDITINPIDSPLFNKCLKGTIKTLPLKEQIIALKEFY